MAQVDLVDIAAGDTLIPDGTFKCLTPNKPYRVERNSRGGLYLNCTAGHHMLDGNLSDDKQSVIGFSKQEHK